MGDASQGRHGQQCDCEANRGSSAHDVLSSAVVRGPCNQPVGGGSRDNTACAGATLAGTSYVFASASNPRYLPRAPDPGPRPPVPRPAGPALDSAPTTRWSASGRLIDARGG